MIMNDNNNNDIRFSEWIARSRINTNQIFELIHMQFLMKTIFFLSLSLSLSRSVIRLFLRVHSCDVFASLSRTLCLHCVCLFYNHNYPAAHTDTDTDKQTPTQTQMQMVNIFLEQNNSISICQCFLFGWWFVCRCRFRHCRTHDDRFDFVVSTTRRHGFFFVCSVFYFFLSVCSMCCFCVCSSRSINIFSFEI